MAAAHSHSAFVSATPTKNSTISNLPNEIRIQFNEDLLLIGDENPNKVELMNPNNEKISGESAAAGPFVFAPITNQDPIPGEYRVNYRIASADGHVVSGTYTFTLAVKKADKAPVTAEPVASDEPVVTEEPVVVAEPEQKDEHHDNFFQHHMEHIIWSLLILSFIGLWALLRFRK